MRLIMLGTGPFAVPTLRALVAGAHEVLSVVTRPPRGRAKASDNPMFQAAQELSQDASLNESLETWAPETVNDAETQERLAAYKADLLVVCDYGEILKPATLATTRFGGVNLHGSLLPKYRGAAPVQRAMLNGDAETGNSVIHMTAGLDAGPCLAQQAMSIDPDETAAELEERLAAAGAPLVCKVVDDIAAGTTTPIPQNCEEMTRAPRLKKSDGAIDWSRTSLEIKNQVRGLIPWPRAFTFWHRPEAEPLRLNVDRVHILKCNDDVPPGSAIEADKKLVIRTGDGALELLEVQSAGKRRMAADDFLRGNRVEAGQQFGGD